MEKPSVCISGYRMPPPKGCPLSVYDLMVKCWEAEPKDRPHFVQLHADLNTIRTQARNN